MVYTYDSTDRNHIIMVSEEPNTYTNPNWHDVVSGVEPFDVWQQTESGAMFIRDSDIIVVDANNVTIFTHPIT